MTKALAWIWLLGLGMHLYFQDIFIYKSKEYLLQVFLSSSPFIVLMIFLYDKYNERENLIPWTGINKEGNFSKYLSLQKKLLPSTRKELKHSEENMTDFKRMGPGKKNTGKFYFYGFIFLFLYLSTVGWALLIDLCSVQSQISYKGIVLEKTTTKTKYSPRIYSINLSTPTGEEVSCSVPEETFEKALEGKEFVVTYRKGMFGFEKH